MTTDTGELQQIVTYLHSQEEVLDAVGQELNRARAKFRPLSSAHEAWAVIREEYLEMEKEVCRKKLHHSRLRTELIQLAAMAVRTIEDLHLMAEVPL